MGSHKRKPKSVLDAESASEQALEEFGHAFLESMQERAPTHQDPFEMYIESVRAHFHTQMPDFHHRLAQGYHALLQMVLVSSSDNPK